MMTRAGTNSADTNVAVGGKARVTRRRDAPKIAERAARRDLGRARAREKHPWGAMLNHFLTPILPGPELDPQWPRLQDVADLFEVSLQTLKARSARYGWLQQQAEAEERFWRARNNEIMRLLGQKIVQIRGEAFAVALKVAQRLSEALNATISLEDAERITRINLRNLETAMEAAGLASSKVPVMPAQPVVSDSRRPLQPLEPVNGQEPGNSSDSPEPTLWQMLKNAQGAFPKVGPEGEDEPDPFDLPSPLPSHLSFAKEHNTPLAS